MPIDNLLKIGIVEVSYLIFNLKHLLNNSDQILATAFYVRSLGSIERRMDRLWWPGSANSQYISKLF